MFKNKIKFISFLLVILTIFSVTSVFADNENDEYGIMLISNDVPTDDEYATMPIDAAEGEVNPDSTENAPVTYKSEDVYLMGNEVIVDYIVDGNLFIMANSVTIKSQIGGDAFIMANNITIDNDGYIANNLFAMADTIDIKGIAYDIYALAQNFNISNGYIYRDLKVACNTLNISGVIGRNVFANFKNANFDANDCKIYGNLNYSSNNEISISDNVVSGEVKYTPVSISEDVSVQTIIANYIWNLGKFLAFLLIIWLICLCLAPKFLENANQNITGKKCLSTFGIGILSLILVPIISLILMLLGLTNGVSLVLFALYILALIISKSLFTIAINNCICNKLNINKNLGKFGMLIVSGIIIWALTQLPYVGWVISLIITIIGLGILVKSIIPKKAPKNEVTEEVVEVSKKDEE